MRYGCAAVLFSAIVEAVQRFRALPSNVSSSLQPEIVSLNATGWRLSAETGTQEAPCKCTSYSTWWKKPNKREPTCLFIDLGAADGETYKAFMGISSKWSFK